MTRDSHGSSGDGPTAPSFGYCLHVQFYVSYNQHGASLSNKGMSIEWTSTANVSVLSEVRRDRALVAALTLSTREHSDPVTKW